MMAAIYGKPIEEMTPEEKVAAYYKHKFRIGDTIQRGDVVKEIRAVMNNAYVFTDNTVLLFQDASGWERVEPHQFMPSDEEE